MGQGEGHINDMSHPMPSCEAFHQTEHGLNVEAFKGYNLILLQLYTYLVMSHDDTFFIISWCIG